MPYASNSELPKAVRGKLSEHQQTVFRRVFNSMVSSGQSESRAFAGAWSQAKKADTQKEFKADIIKIEPDQQLVWGWAYVCTVDGAISLDHSSEFVTPAEMEKAATNFMLDARVAKAMHSGDQVGEVIHSLPLTKELAKALGIQSDREGWIICMKIHDPLIWKRVKSGELPAFSIGGRALKEALDAY